jgi:hypothetical protein
MNFIRKLSVALLAILSLCIATTNETFASPAGYVSQGGLIWSPISTTIGTWSQASTLCAGTINGQSNWRLPTATELSSLATSGALNGSGWALNGAWSSNPGTTGTHVIVDMSVGVAIGSFSDTGNSYMTCVQAATASSTLNSQTIGTISFSPATLAVGGTTTASATATSALPVTFSSTTPSVCKVSGSTVTAVAAGTCTIAADQAGGGNTSYSAAPEVTQSITVGAASKNDCLFNWAERTYPQYFAPAGVVDAAFPPYTYRYYSSTRNFLAVSSADNNVYVMGPSFGSSPVALACQAVNKHLGGYK